MANRRKNRLLRHLVFGFYEPLTNWVENMKTLTYLGKGIEAHSIDKTNGWVTTIKVSRGLEIHNVYLLEREGQSGPVVDRVTAIPACEYVIA
jgi:hypothetical protein